MQRLSQLPRSNWQARLDQTGFHFHSIDAEGNDRRGTDRFFYWREDVAYRFTEAQVDIVDDAVAELHQMCMELAGELIQCGDLARLGLSPRAQELVTASWRAKDPHLYGRFDLSWDGAGAPKLLEYNADTPTSIIETAVAQWFWKVDVKPRADQFNSLHEALVERWAHVARHHNVGTIHLAGSLDCQEDVGNLEYLLDTLVQAGLAGRILDVGEISLARDGNFVTPDEQTLEACFKLYPWEWMVEEEFASALPTAGTAWLEPVWKMVLSNKAMLALLWERHPGHPNLLETSFNPRALSSQAYARKPFLSREGANIVLHDGASTVETEGPYGKEGVVFQALAPLPRFIDRELKAQHAPGTPVHAVIGAWVVGDKPAGICIREDVSPVTCNTSYFVPHYFD